jgi:hypothetical protein
MAKYWFRQKRFGYGSTPNTWQGWALTILVLLLILALVFLGPSIRDDASRALWMALGIVLIILPFAAIARLKTEGGWCWRNKNE